MNRNNQSKPDQKPDRDRSKPDPNVKPPTYQYVNEGYDPSRVKKKNE